LAQIALLMAIAGCDGRDVYLGSDVRPQLQLGSGGHETGGAGGGAGGVPGNAGSGGMMPIADAGTGLGSGSGGMTVPPPPPPPVQDSGAGDAGMKDAGVTPSDCPTGFADCDGLADNGCEARVEDAGCPKCPTGFADCDGRDDNGCETDIDSDDNHCGDCNTACPPFGIMSFGSNCTAGECVLICEGVFADCDGDPSTGCESVGPCP
jgi:hypothetical protein